MHELDTLTLEEAADYLHCELSTLQRLASQREVPGAKIGRGWVFVRQHLADYIKQRYFDEVQKGAADNVEEPQCQSISARVRPIGKSRSASKGDEFSDLLAQVRARKPKS